MQKGNKQAVANKRPKDESPRKGPGTQGEDETQPKGKAGVGVEDESEDEMEDEMEGESEDSADDPTLASPVFKGKKKSSPK